MVTSESLSGLFAGLRGGDQGTRNRLLLTHLYDRLVRLSAVMLRGFPVVQRRREAESVANDLAVKLLNALDGGLKMRSTQDLLRLAAAKLRHLLIDEADKQRRRAGLLADRGGGTGHMVSLGAADSRADGGGAVDAPAPDSADPAVLAEWTEFHARVVALPDDERTVFELHFFLQMPQSEVAESFGWEAKRVSRLWIGAVGKLGRHMPHLG